LADERMTEMVDPVAMTPRLVPSCIDPARGIAFPPRRLVELAQGLEASGAATTMQSICSEDFTAAMDGILRRVADGLSGSCQ
jgi:hypothetical protein